MYICIFIHLFTYLFIYIITYRIYEHKDPTKHGLGSQALEPECRILTVDSKKMVYEPVTINAGSF